MQKLATKEIEKLRKPNHCTSCNLLIHFPGTRSWNFINKDLEPTILPFFPFSTNSPWQELPL